ncbi:MAG: glycosyltransferase [Bacteroidales bacterium]|nr:glycosyltransferase [Bacteroidales bacterium]
MRIAFVLVVHPPHDERVWYQEAESLKKTGSQIHIISTRVENSELPNTYTFDDINLNKKEVIKRIFSFLKTIQPDVIICDNPIAILSAKKYKRIIKVNPPRIIYDITEWYPSKKNLRGISFIKKCIKIPALVFLSYYTSWFVDGFIFGECDKGTPFRIFFPWKKYIYLPYYADPNLIKVYPVKDISKECVFFYAGSLTQEKGFYSVLKVVMGCVEKYPDVNFTLQLISSDNLPIYPSHPGLKINKKPFLPFLPFCEEIGKADFFFDLRAIDIENTRCLPIKLFYYMAAGRPVIYSDLQAIKKAVPEIDQIGVLTDPKDAEGIASRIGYYLENPDYYKAQCNRARELAEQKYNWQSIEEGFIQFILGNGCS